MFASGQIALIENGVQIGAGYLDPATGTGSLGATLSPGQHNIVVGYGGDSNYNPAQSNPIQVTIGGDGKITPTVTGVATVNGSTVTIAITVA